MPTKTLFPILHIYILLFSFYIYIYIYIYINRGLGACIVILVSNSVDLHTSIYLFFRCLCLALGAGLPYNTIITATYLGASKIAAFHPPYLLLDFPRYLCFCPLGQICIVTVLLSHNVRCVRWQWSIVFAPFLSGLLHRCACAFNTLYEELRRACLAVLGVSMGLPSRNYSKAISRAARWLLVFVSCCLSCLFGELLVGKGMALSLYRPCVMSAKLLVVTFKSLTVAPGICIIMCN